LPYRRAPSPKFHNFGYFTATAPNLSGSTQAAVTASALEFPARYLLGRERAPAGS